MKELLSFTFALLFISCQNIAPKVLTASPTAEATTKPAMTTVVSDSFSCETLPEESWDLVKQLEDKNQPGIHYRAATMSSEADSESGYDSFVCVSQITSSEDLTDPVTPASDSAPSMTDDTPPTEPIAALEGWKTLTEKWEIRPALAACYDRNAQSEGPTCATSAEFLVATDEATL
jgi:hypothetical protein